MCLDLAMYCCHFISKQVFYSITILSQCHCIYFRNNYRESTILNPQNRTQNALSRVDILFWFRINEIFMFLRAQCDQRMRHTARPSLYFECVCAKYTKNDVARAWDTLCISCSFLLTMCIHLCSAHYLGFNAASKHICTCMHDWNFTSSLWDASLVSFRSGKSVAVLSGVVSSMHC